MSLKLGHSTESFEGDFPTVSIDFRYKTCIVKTTMVRFEFDFVSLISQVFLKSKKSQMVYLS